MSSICKCFDQPPDLPPHTEQIQGLTIEGTLVYMTCFLGYRTEFDNEENDCFIDVVKFLSIDAC
jgi:hypothetical protein